MVSPSSIKNPLSSTAQDNLTEKNEPLVTRCSCPCCQRTFLPQDKGEIPSSSSPLLSSLQKDNGKRSRWLRRSGRQHKKAEPLGSKSNPEQISADALSLSLSSRRRAEGNGNSVPASHSEISAPLRRDQTHAYSPQLGRLEQVRDGNDVDVDDEEQVVENCEKCICISTSSSTRCSHVHWRNISCLSELELLSLPREVPRNSSESESSERFCFPCCESCNNNDCVHDYFPGVCGGEGVLSSSFTGDFSKGESWARGSAGSSGDFTEFKNRYGQVDVDIDKQVNYRYDVNDDGGKVEMRTMNMISNSSHKSGGGVRSFKERYLWLACAFLLFLSVLSSANAFSVLDDDDEDEFGGHSVLSRSRRSAESFSILNDALSLIPSNYSIHEPPPTNNSEATQVDFSVLIMNVRDIKELNEGYGDLELSLEMNLRIYWKDTRLSHLADRSGNKFIVLNPVLLDKIWHPDIFIDHVKGVAQPALISKPASLRIYPDSSVRYSARITVTMACQMDFHYYPADTQRCDVDMKSYAYSSRILALDWREGKGALLVEYLELPNFDVALDTTQNFMVNTSSGSYSGIRFTILLRRKLSYHLIQTYLPSTLFIIVSWLSFLVPPESVPGRMALCMTTLLTLTAMFSAVRQNTPNVSYVKALDIWMVVCIIFVFLTLVEYTVLLKLRSKKPKPRPPDSQAEVIPPTAPQQLPQQQTITRWTIPSLQYSADDAPNFKFRGCKSVEVVINENGTTAEMRHRENGNHGVSNDAGGGDNENNVPPPQPPISAQPTPPPPPQQPMHPSERPLNKYELAAKKIEKFTSAVIPTLFVIFNFIYWPWLIESADYYNHDKTTTIFKSM